MVLNALMTAAAEIHNCLPAVPRKRRLAKICNAQQWEFCLICGCVALCFMLCVCRTKFALFPSGKLFLKLLFSLFGVSFPSSASPQKAGVLHQC